MWNQVGQLCFACQESQGSHPQAMSFFCGSSELQSTFGRQDQDGPPPRCGQLRVFRQWRRVLNVQHGLNGQLSPLLPQECGAGSGLLSIPHNGTFVWGQPDPALVARAMCRYVHGPVLGRDWPLRRVVADAKRLPFSDVLPHPFTHHGSCDGIHKTRLLRYTSGRPRGAS